mmetsp:Transcript_27131/g.86193  ORF Transcript_27131/g.86193 Transcript_27131/m.86193 type:complete len:404 (+) Transcript_27131:74-1285(+)
MARFCSIPLVAGVVAACAIPLAVLVAQRRDSYWQWVGWSFTQGGGFRPTVLLKLGYYLLDQDVLSPGRGLDIPTSLAGQVAVITGSTQGIGYEAAKRFHALGAHVVISGRTQATCEERAAMLRSLGGPGQATGMSVQLDDLDDVRRFAAELLGKFKKVDFLILNAAMSAARMPDPKYYVTKHGHDRVYTANYLSGFLLVRLLLPKLVPGGTVIFVSSVVMWSAIFDLLSPAGGRVAWELLPQVDIYQQYQVSKLALCVCLRDALARRIPKHRLKLGSMVPGFIKTNMTLGSWANPNYRPGYYGWLAPTEEGGRLLFESAFATLPHEKDFMYPFWFPTSIYGRFRAATEWSTRVGISGYFVQPQNYQRLFGMQLHAGLSPECDIKSEHQLWVWSSNATGLPEKL